MCEVCEDDSSICPDVTEGTIYDDKCSCFIALQISTKCSIHAFVIFKFKINDIPIPSQLEEEVHLV